MIFTSVSYTNGSGAVLSLTDPDGIVRAVSIDGISAKSSVSVSPYSCSDGGAFVSERSESRSISIMLAFCGDYNLCRNILYSTFLLKDCGSLSYTAPDGSAYSIPCYVENVNMPLAERSVTAMISLICPDPYWISEAESSVSILAVTGLWQFPWEISCDGFEFASISNNRIASVVNRGEVDIGGIFTINVRANAKNPRLENINTHEWIELNIDLFANDVVIINTVKGKKSITLIRDQISYNIINSKVWGSTFLQLASGLNEIVCNAKSGNESISVTISYAEKFGGV